MPFLMIRDDITKVKADMIVDPADIKKIEKCKTGKEEKILYNAYRLSLRLARRRKCESIAFPLFTPCNYEFSKEKAIKIAISAFRDFLMKHDILIYLVLDNRDSFSIGQKFFSEIKKYIDDHYVEDSEKVCEKVYGKVYEEALPMMASLAPMASAPAQDMASKDVSKNLFELGRRKRNLDDLINNLDETFSQMLLRLIDERGLKDSVVYKKANIDRRHFSKIRNNINYLPTKKTVFSFAIALKLSLDETKDLMNKAGYSISKSSKFDVIISYFLENSIYDIFEINEVLFMYEHRFPYRSGY